MKVQNANESNTDFKPIEVTITIESLLEHNAFLDMALRNVSIPNLFEIEYQDVIKEFQDKMFKAIINN